MHTVRTCTQKIGDWYQEVPFKEKAKTVAMISALALLALACIAVAIAGLAGLAYCAVVIFQESVFLGIEFLAAMISIIGTGILFRNDEDSRDAVCASFAALGYMASKA